DARAAVFIRGLHDERLALRTDVRQQVVRRAVSRRPALANHARPWDVPADQRALFLVEEAGVAIVGQDGEERLLVRNLAAERVGHADGASLVRLYERRALLGPGDDVVDEHAAIHEVDRASLGDESAACELE